MQNDYTTVDELIDEIVDSRSTYTHAAVRRLTQLCHESCEAYGYLHDRVLDLQLPEPVQRQLGDVLTTAQIHLLGCSDCTQTCQAMLYGNDTLGYVLRRHSVPKIS